MRNPSSPPLLRASDIHVAFSRGGLFRRGHQPVLRGLSLTLEEGRCLGIVGESGSGKSTLGRVLVGLLRPDRGDVAVDGKNLYGTGRGASFHPCSVVFQDYSTSVNPRFSVEEILAEPLKKGFGDAKERRDRILALLEKVGLSSDLLRRRPHQLSGGQLQRICIARAVASRPRFILLDEATSSLDVSVQVQVMDLLAELRRDEGLSLLFITHDLTAVTYLCDSVLFMNDGRIVERVDDLSRLHAVRDIHSRRLLDAATAL